MSRTTAPRRSSPARPRLALGARANRLEVARAKALAAAALQESPLMDALAERFYGSDMYAALDLIMIDRMPATMYERHAGLLQVMDGEYDSLITEVCYAAFRLGVSMMTPRELSTIAQAPAASRGERPATGGAR